MRRKEIVVGQVRRNKSIIYGGEALKQQVGLIFARPTEDIDVFSNQPFKEAKRTTKILNRSSRGRHYYVKPAEHKGTWKIKHVGFDLIPKTKDDIQVADYTIKPKKIRTIKMNGVNYAHLSEVKRSKKNILKQKEFKFRHEKDRDDLSRIRFAEEIRRFG